MLGEPYPFERPSLPSDQRGKRKAVKAGGPGRDPLRRLEPGETGYRVELIHEVEGWLDQPRVQVPTWRVGRAATLEQAVAPHYAHLERAYRLPRWASRAR